MLSMKYKLLNWRRYSEQEGVSEEGPESKVQQQGARDPEECKEAAGGTQKMMVALGIYPRGALASRLTLHIIA